MSCARREGRSEESHITTHDHDYDTGTKPVVISSEFGIYLDGRCRSLENGSSIAFYAPNLTMLALQICYLDPTTHSSTLRSASERCSIHLIIIVNSLDLWRTTRFLHTIRPFWSLKSRKLNLQGQTYTLTTP